MGNKKHKKHKSENRTPNESEDEGQPSEKRIKLVLNLKTGGSGQDNGPEHSDSPAHNEERKHKHKKKKKKKSSDKEREKPKAEETPLKRPHEDEESPEEEEEEDVGVPKGGNESDRKENVTTISDYESDGNSSPSRRLRERAQKAGGDGVILKQMLHYLLKILQNKDVNGFFAFPVTDNIAPGYSSIITTPMDFSTMALKIDACEYVNVMEFKKDFILMCNNAMTYNRPETIYYREAKRLLQIGIRQLSKEKLLHLKKTQSFLACITLQELGFDESGHVVETQAQPSHEENKDKPKEEPTNPEEHDADKYSVIPDDELSPEEILSQAKSAAKQARAELVARKPKTDLGFLRLEDDGTTSMTILNPWNDGVVSSTQKVISLGDYMGRLKNGSGSLFRFKEDRRNKVCPESALFETYLCYGPFSSHAPSYDSSFASCTKEESDLLLHTYGGEVGVQYAKSVQKFVETAGISATEMVDKLLDTLTNGQHSKSKVLLEEQKVREEEAAERALQDEMIVKAQKAAEEAERAISKDFVQQSLNQTAAMLSELSDTQKERLSQDPPSHLAFVAQPSDKESDLANKVTTNLMGLAKQVNPRDVVSTKAVRGALGITTKPVTQQTSAPASTAGSVKSVGASTTTNKNKVADDSEDDDDDESDDDDEDDGAEDNVEGADNNLGRKDDDEKGVSTQDEEMDSDEDEDEDDEDDDDD